MHYKVSAYHEGEIEEFYFNDYEIARQKYNNLLFDQVFEIRYLLEVIFAERSRDGSEYLPIFRSQNDHPIGIYEAGHSKASWSDCIEAIIEEKRGGNVSAVARDMGIDPSNLHAMLAHGRGKSNHNRLPSLETLCSIAETLGYHVGFVPDEVGQTYTFHDEKECRRRGRPRRED